MKNNRNMKSIWLRTFALTMLLFGCVGQESDEVNKTLLSGRWVLQQHTIEYVDEAGEIYESLLDEETEGFLEFFRDDTFISDGLFAVNEGGIYFLTEFGTYFLEYGKRYIHFNKGMNEQVYFPEVYLEIQEITNEKMTLVLREQTREYFETYRFLGFQTGKIEAELASEKKNYDEGFEIGLNYGDYVGFVEHFTADRHDTYYDGFSFGYKQGFSEYFQNNGNDFTNGFNAGYEQGYLSGKAYGEEETARNPRRHGQVVYTYEFIRE